MNSTAVVLNHPPHRGVQQTHLRQGAVSPTGTPRATARGEPFVPQNGNKAGGPVSPSQEDCKTYSGGWRRIKHDELDTRIAMKIEALEAFIKKHGTDGGTPANRSLELMKALELNDE